MPLPGPRLAALVLGAGACAVLTACGSPSPLVAPPVVGTPAVTVSTGPAPPTPGGPTAVLQPQPSSAVPPPPTAAGTLMAQRLSDGLKAGGLPVAEVTTYPPALDPSNLLGRPNQYIARVTWTDTRLPTQRQGCSVEAFSTQADLSARMAYLTSVGRATNGGASPPLYQNDRQLLLLRLPQGLTPDQVNGYTTWLANVGEAATPTPAGS